MTDKAVEIAEEILTFLNSSNYMFAKGKTEDLLVDLIRPHLAPEWLRERLEAVLCIISVPCDKEERMCAYDELQEVLDKLPEAPHE